MGDEGRALLIERERWILSREANVGDNYRYKIESIVRSRLRGHLERDVAVLAEHFDNGYQIVKEVYEEVCENIDRKERWLGFWRTVVFTHR